MTSPAEDRALILDPSSSGRVNGCSVLLALPGKGKGGREDKLRDIVRRALEASKGSINQGLMGDFRQHMRYSHPMFHGGAMRGSLRTNTWSYAPWVCVPLIAAGLACIGALETQTDHLPLALCREYQL